MRTLYKLSETVFAIHFRHGRVTEENVRADLPKSLIMLAEQNGYLITFKEEKEGEAGRYRATCDLMRRTFPEEVANLERICSAPDEYILVRLKRSLRSGALGSSLNLPLPPIKLGNADWSPDYGDGR